MDGKLECSALRNVTIQKFDAQNSFFFLQMLHMQAIESIVMRTILNWAVKNLGHFVKSEDYESESEQTASHPPRMDMERENDYDGLEYMRT